MQLLALCLYECTLQGRVYLRPKKHSQIPRASMVHVGGGEKNRNNSAINYVPPTPMKERLCLFHFSDHTFLRLQQLCCN